ncbi:hypothetical protein DICPUDRAFT_43611 [Dictyostelium purpureum]|uniref:Uncharacterized protein n=1 Tax=Dictyostelium purpureum TaxID=5786 RepID=F1A4F5_DICPU|nr:uncharacterized protein DICPUDRAFT_43611 [Dictyostelium purpureum]EGC28924.1 hypothetical protein DICPUDRAFT_43611 [Dictyostelium purpureum]|eukprot:XP_003294549.1 hypothetical protein DICPUDRAFT_43611 [Dictyostelium purpureum]
MSSNDNTEPKKLYDDLNLIFKNNPNINEIGFVISTKDYDGLENKPFVVVENKLGFSFLWLTKLYSFCFHRFIELKNDFDSLINEFLKIKVDDTIFKSTSDLIEKLIEATRNVLSINAENVTALNQRKKLIILEMVDHQTEINLLNLIFTKHPKSGEGWAHRKWIYTDYYKKTNQYLSYQIELDVCKRVAEIYPKNYYAWTHRWWILKNLSIELFLKDLELMEDWIKRNISDYCGYHHRYLILTTLFKIFFNIKDGKDPQIDEIEFSNQVLNENLFLEIWSKEFKFIEKVIKMYPGHESPWNYKRTISLFWLENSELISKSSHSNLLLPITSVYKECLFVHSIIQDNESSYYLKQKSFAEDYLSSIYQVYNKDYLGDSNFNLETLKQNYTKLITQLKKSNPDKINVFDYKINKFTK